MESYRIIRDPQDRTCQYDFTFGNGVNVQVEFEIMPNDPTGRPASGGSAQLAVFDSDRNNITDRVLRQFRERQSGEVPVAALAPRQRPLQAHEVEHLIHFVRELQSPQKGLGQQPRRLRF